MKDSYEPSIGLVPTGVQVLLPSFKYSGENMKLSKNEKDLLIDLLKSHLDEIKELESSPDDYFLQFAGEVKYDRFIQGIIDKLKHKE